ncbi:MAG TPA: glycosyltransferase [Niabella sp.]|nr:glycosyltransferase [Niabella sp.]
MFWILLQIIVSVSLWIAPVLLLTGIFRKKNTAKIATREDLKDYAIIVTAYQQAGLIDKVVASILNLNYDEYLVYVVADNCDISEIKVRHPKVKILRPENVLASNIRSHFYAINRFERMHDIVTIIDSDNLVDREYLNELNVFFKQGYKAVQGTRKAKNLNTIYACLDEAGDIYYRFTDRKLPFDAGSSASLAGSGMAFTTSIYKACLEHLSLDGAGFDKVLQYELVKRNEKIAFAERAVVYDEKTAKTDQLVKQRARWINTWFRFWRLGLIMLLQSLRKFNWNGFVFSSMLLRPPLFLMVLAIGIICLINIFTVPFMLAYWGFLCLLFILVFARSLRYFKADKRVYNSIRHAPRFIFFQLIAFGKAGKANKISVATEHDLSGGTEIK